MPRVLHDTRHARLRACAVLLASVLLPGLASCSDDLAAELNPAPKHVIKISGRMPASLDVTLVAKYSIHSKACAPDPMPPWPLGAAMMQKYFKRVDLQITRTGDRYETSFAVDRYLPGKCDWRFTGVGYHVTSTGGREYVNASAIISGYTFYHPDYRYEGQCDGVDEGTCHKRANALDTPVIVLCYMFTQTIPHKPGVEVDKTPWFTCGPKSHSYKQEHFLMPDSKHIKVDFYDLEVDPDPTVQ